MEDLLSSKRSSLLSSLATQNMTLKVSLIVAGIVFLIETIGFICLAFKEPLVVGLAENGPKIMAPLEEADSITLPEIRAFVFDLLNRKFSKNPLQDLQMSVCRYFSSGLRTACEKEIQQRKSVIPQEIVIQQLTWDENSEKANVQMKRFVNINGIISAIETSVVIKISKESRTEQNPWGLFVRDWKEEVRR
jgi:hypothetical protein